MPSVISHADVPEMKFLCDEMLSRLGRWLRAAGYDTVIAETGQPDRQLIEQALRERRLLLTRDRKLTEFRRAAGCVDIVAADKVEQQAMEVTRRHAIDWLHAPFSRCLVCNSSLVTADPARRAEIPPFSRDQATGLLTCSGCGRLYWDGSHVRRMRIRLERWQHIDR